MGRTTKRSSVTERCVKWGISQALPPCSVFLKNVGQVMLNFYPLDMSISLQMISVHRETHSGFKPNTKRNIVCT